MKTIPKQEYTAQFKEQVVKRPLKVGIGVAARELGLVVQMQRNWFRAAAVGTLTAPGARPVTPEQMELSRLRAENVRAETARRMQRESTRRPVCSSTSKFSTTAVSATLR